MLGKYSTCTYICQGEIKQKKTSIANHSGDHLVVKWKAGAALATELPVPSMTQDRHLTTEVLCPRFISRKREHIYHQVSHFSDTESKVPCRLGRWACGDTECLLDE